MKASEPARVTYWPGWGRCEPLRCILAAAGVPFTNNFLTAESGRSKLESLRTAGMLQYDQVRPKGSALPAPAKSPDPAVTHAHAHVT